MLTKTVHLTRLVLGALALIGSMLTAIATGQPAASATVATGRAGVPLPSLRVILDSNGRVTLIGVVPDGLERDLITRRARQLYGAEQVTNLLQLGEVGNPAWLGADFLPDLRGARAATALLENGSLQVEGEVSTHDAMQRIASALEDIRRRGVTVDNRLRPRVEGAAPVR